jgi:hypothetical protein
MTDTKVITNGAHGPLKGMLKSLFSLTDSVMVLYVFVLIKNCMMATMAGQDNA